MSIKTSFSIKDLENLSGVKAHTIRIWEKRYNLFQPKRSDTNIRTYDLKSLQKVLNIAFLLENGHKISKLAKLKESEISTKVNELSTINGDILHTINTFKLSMLNFDQKLFDDTYYQLLTQYSFQEIFNIFFIKLLKHIGLLWTSNTILPAHEHFISTLIKQKILVNIEKVKSQNQKTNKTYILFLPHNEIHDIGLLYIHYELLSKGHQSVYLGESLPIENLLEIQKVFSHIIFISYFTVEPNKNNTLTYLEELYDSILATRNERLHILGNNTAHLEADKLPPNVVLHHNPMHLIEAIE
ncbi:MerR family transcriptional regulator [Reichenbachiella sp. MALMAid0571]|uniref:MerR family transcriptional regulator n=1 Tax=Reichenbachiella sp. MALMAid0571 TaxID=3143939 RepID=UPI0032DEC9E9